jgi:hypothetical protein
MERKAKPVVEFIPPSRNMACQNPNGCASTDLRILQKLGRCRRHRCKVCGYTFESIEPEYHNTNRP